MRAELPGSTGHAPVDRPNVSAHGSPPVAPPLRVRAATPADTDRILELVRVSLGEGVIPRDAGYWSWKHHRNPFGESAMLLAESGDRLLGLRAFMRWTWETASGRYSAVQAVDTATHPDARGQGIFSRLTLELVERMRSEGVRFVFNTPNGKSRPGYLKMGWKSVGRTDLWIRPLRPLRVLRSLAARGGVGVPVIAADADLPGDADPPGRLLAEPAFAAFLERVRAGSRGVGLSTPYDPAYLGWRYLEVPGIRYGAVYDLDGAGDGAAILFRVRPQGGLRELRICDLLTTGSARSRAAGAGLLAHLSRRADADYVAVMKPRWLATRLLLLRSGFLPAPRIGPILTVRALNVEGMERSPVHRSAWAASIGDLELF